MFPGVYALARTLRTVAHAVRAESLRCLRVPCVAKPQAMRRIVICDHERQLL